MNKIVPMNSWLPDFLTDVLTDMWKYCTVNMQCLSESATTDRNYKQLCLLQRITKNSINARYITCLTFKYTSEEQKRKFLYINKLE